MKQIDIVSYMINELNNIGTKEAYKVKLFMEFNKKLCNDVLYTDNKYKQETIIITNIFKNLMVDFCKEVNDCINKEGVYKHE